MVIASASAVTLGDVLAVVVPLSLLLFGALGWFMRAKLSSNDAAIADLNQRQNTDHSTLIELRTRAETFSTHENRISALALNQSSQQTEIEYMRADLDRLAPRVLGGG